MIEYVVLFRKFQISLKIAHLIGTHRNKALKEQSTPSKVQLANRQEARVGEVPRTLMDLFKNFAKNQNCNF